MWQQQKDNDEENESIHALRDLHVLMHVLYNSTLVFQYFEDSKQFSEFYKPVKSSDSCYSSQFIERRID